MDAVIDGTCRTTGHASLSFGSSVVGTPVHGGGVNGAERIHDGIHTVIELLLLVVVVVNVTVLRDHCLL